ncbi:hypothetical protein VJI77_02085 [Parvimonas sp. D2]|uniref:hypothetical protein n=1 Tax=unclassified Parvimonas TaxID=1151464 RepID=UPI002B4701AC|nr:MULTISPECIES: hypothetical protein [unclassified Parvimonas]MEB3011796.1 hypothetical protein [Parvimonas sp. D2]MEB3087288.1 hypothetical protein [Parvimonas sp. D4]
MKGLLLLEYLEIKKKWYFFTLDLILLCVGVFFEMLFTYIFVFSVIGSRDVGNNFERNKKINKYILTTKFSRKDLIVSKFLVSTLKILVYYIILFVFVRIFNSSFLLSLLGYFFTAIFINPIVQYSYFVFKDRDDIVPFFVMITFPLLFMLLGFKYLPNFIGLYENTYLLILFFIAIFSLNVLCNIYLLKATVKNIEYEDF